MATIIDASGFSRDRLDVIKANVDAAMQAIYGDDMDLGPSSPDGQYTAITAEAADTVGQLAEDDFNARSPANASGAALSRLVRLNGITRNPATYSTADGVHTGTPGTVIPDGALIDTTDEPAGHFQTVGAVTIGAGGTVAGTVRGTTTGPVFGSAGSITVLKTVISGWTAFSNTADVNLGSDIETDAALRVRRDASVAITGRAVIDSLYAALANIHGVTDVAVFENKTGSPIPRTGASDLPPNAIQVVVRGGLDADIAAAIWAKASGGATLVGGTAVNVVDAQGIGQTVKYDRPTDLLIHGIVSITYPSNGPPPTAAQRDAVAAAFVAQGRSTAKTGARIQIGQFYAAVYAVLTPPYGVFYTSINVDGSLHVYDLSIPFSSFPTYDVAAVTVFGSPVPP